MADYGGFGAIMREAAALAEAEKRRALVDCPLCGMALVVRDGTGNCPMGHWRGPVQGGRP